MEHASPPSEGPTWTVQGTDAGGHIDGLVPEALAALSAAALGSPDDVRGEIDAMNAAVRHFWRLQPDQVMRDCAAYSARCTEMEIHLMRVVARDRHYKQLDTQVRKVIAELERQFKIASRLIEIRRQDIALER